MGGSVTEWVQDEYKGSYDGAPTNGNARCNASDCSKNTSNAVRVLRGGSWYSGGAWSFRAADRYYLSPTGQNGFIGGRVARSIP